MLKIILHIKLISGFTFVTFLLLFTCTTLFLYAKEYFDYKISHHLFSQKNDFESSLYKFFQKAKDETKVNSLINNLMNEIRDVLMVKEVVYIEIVTEEDGDHWLVKNRNDYPSTFAEELETINWNYCQTGSLMEIMDGFGIAIGGDYKKKNIIFCGRKKAKTNLNIQERIWLETLAYISSILLENFQLIEGLFQKIEDYKEKKEEIHDSYPSWLSRLLFTLSEKERANLSIDLHDSVLQDLLQLLREVDNIREKVEDPRLKNELLELKERMLDNIHLIRETCNELRPPFLSELGIIQSIQLLFERIKLRSDFILYFELEPSIQMMNKEYELPLYRVVQELLNNAMKHSKASEVHISLTQRNQTLTLVYQDNGIGMDMTKLKDSFKTIGLAGIKERIKSIDGTMEICSTPGNGMKVLIELITGSDEID
jgi:two-component system, NarL family, sensor histidine kinase ComP